jgi:sugar lactone lactonase YvrE
MRIHLARVGTLSACSAAFITASWLAASPAMAQTAVDVTGTPVIYTAAGNGTPGFSGDGGAANKAALKMPTGVGEDVAGNVYFSDTGNNRIRMVASASSGVIQTVAGDGHDGFGGDGGPATRARLSHPSGIVIDKLGRLFIADTGNNRIRKVTSSGTISTYAGGGHRGDDCRESENPDDGEMGMRAVSRNGMGAGSTLCSPTGLALDSQGNLFVSDTGNNRVREISATGVTTTAAGIGSAGFSGDGGAATLARLNGPTGLAVDLLHDVVIADTFNNRIRQVSPSGTITTIAGTGDGGYNGDGKPATAAELAKPTGLGLNPTGVLFVSDTGNNRIRQIDASKMISTYVGKGVPGYSGDGGPANEAKIRRPSGLVASDGTHLYFADTGNERIRAVSSGPPPVIPETSYILLLPISAVILGGGALLILRRRRRSAVLAAS